MAKYRLHIFCDQCSNPHPVPMAFELDDGPADKASIGDLYGGKELPPAVATISKVNIVCPTTGAMVERMVQQPRQHEPGVWQPPLPQLPGAYASPTPSYLPLGASE